ncbi:hypothetical protein [Sphingomonas sp. UBA978]|uniref:hypothetical protein n=1 Tax=Sphingomonas sp. UBA978 TaxID=1947536 RepID=UPI0025EAD716|nr:hypothetical protein [Sphingomonas sp. UBA978]
MNGTRLHRIWGGMVARCQRDSHTSFERYGGKGITVCENWKSFDVFLKWAAESGYRDDLTLDRVDNAQGYQPSNCRWATRKEQSANRATVLKRSDGTPWFQIAEMNGIDKHLYSGRVRHGWPPEKAATQPKRILASRGQ